ncbi:hypothetical protein BDY19DRAFT_898320 [Irpex rosettiformis]|uniref:Uncharacterized protein n=1 Tax=Irpex rosettiformis TaxID=378272 RepID=A0ACB8TRD8_9APHY|nr:hypothetical protein BDY19DRAFT_898320 [Irpex rosettiformis]
MADKEAETLLVADDAPVSTPTRKKSRRQVAFYPNMNQANKPTKPFSRSAAKRESVMALGSIEHLQHYFTKTGLSAKTNPSNGKTMKGMVPAIGGADTKGETSPNDTQDLQLPPSPVVPQIVHPTFSTYVKTYEIDPENIRPSVIEDVSAVEQIWWLGSTPPQDLLSVDDARGKPHDPEHVDVLDMLRATTHAVRSVRNYLLTLPDDSATPVQTQFLSKVTPSARHPVPRRQASQPDLATDPLTRIRRSALEVLGVLRTVEELSRLPLSDEAYDAQSDHGEQGSGSGGSHSRANSPAMSDTDTSVSISYVQVGGKNVSVPVWEDEDDFDMNQMTEEDKRDRWDERLVLGGGWLYRQDVRRSDLEKERQTIARYLDAVDDVLFGGRKDGKRGWILEREKAEKAERDRRGKGRRVSASAAEVSQVKRSNRRVVSTGMLDAMKAMVVSEETEEPEDLGSISEVDSVDDDDLPEWAKRSSFEDDPYGRLLALLQALLPTTLTSLLPPAPAERSSLLYALSSGQLLCVAYNTGVRRSRKPWGFISRDSIHDIAALEAQSLDKDETEQEKARHGWTFRRTDNLRLWVAALKLRYEIPIVSPSVQLNNGILTPGNGTTPLSSPTPTAKKFPRTEEPPITFDAVIVAHRDPEWEAMLEVPILRWMEAVVDEKRG